MYNACIRVFMRYFSRTARLINDDMNLLYMGKLLRSSNMSVAACKGYVIT